MGKDLGTYYVHVKFEDGDGFINRWDTCARYTQGHDNAPLTASRIPPTWEDEAELLQSIEFQFAENNYSCDCNRRLFLARAHQREVTEFECGEELRIVSLIVECPDGRMVDLGVDERKGGKRG